MYLLYYWKETWIHKKKVRDYMWGPPFSRSRVSSSYNFKTATSFMWSWCLILPMNIPPRIVDLLLHSLKRPIGIVAQKKICFSLACFGFLTFLKKKNRRPAIEGEHDSVQGDYREITNVILTNIFNSSNYYQSFDFHFNNF